MKLYAHQESAASIMADRGRFGLFAQPGCGKTITALEAVTRVAPEGRWVVACPLAVARTAWVNDSAMYPMIRLRMGAGSGPIARKRAIVEPGAALLVLNFEVYSKHVDDLIANGWNRLIVDESSKCKNPETRITRAVLRHSAACRSVFLLSGTPAPNGDHEYWSQLRAIAPSRVSPNFHTFAYRYFTPRMTDVRVKGGTRRVISGWNPKTGQARDEFLSLLAENSVAIRKADCLDLPKQTDAIREVQLSSAERRAYDDVADNLRILIRDGGGVRNVRVKAEAAIHKLRQLCGGWCYDADTAHAYGQSKLDALADLLDELGSSPALIWVDYRHDAQVVHNLLKSRGDKHACLVGGSSDDTSGSVSAFQGGDLRYLVCHPASVGHGVTMTRAADAVYFSVPWSYELYEQSRDRIHRIGQTIPCVYHHLIASDTVDWAVLRAVRRKKSGADAVLESLAGAAAGASDENNNGVGGIVPDRPLRAGRHDRASAAAVPSPGVV